MDSSVLLSLIVGAAMSIGVTSWLWLPEDNDIEEIAEEVIKNKTGIDIDLSPASPEKRT